MPNKTLKILKSNRKFRFFHIFSYLCHTKTKYLWQRESYSSIKRLYLTYPKPNWP